MADRTIDCVDCNAPFIFTDAERDFYSSRGLADPKRCKSCRIAKRARLNNGSSRQLFDAVCSTCGESCQVPFEPKPGRPVYCRTHLPPKA